MIYKMIHCRTGLCGASVAAINFKFFETRKNQRACQLLQAIIIIQLTQGHIINYTVQKNNRIINHIP